MTSKTLPGTDDIACPALAGETTENLCEQIPLLAGPVARGCDRNQLGSLKRSVAKVFRPVAKGLEGLFVRL